MKKSLLINVMAVLVTIVMFAVFATASAVAQGEPCSQCGPGPHWVDDCPAGQDQIKNHTALMGIDMDLDCEADVNLVLSRCGDTLLVVDRSDPYEGDSVGDPGHLNKIDTEIVSMCLRGGGVTLKAGLGQGRIISPSLGAITEHPPDPCHAESFFDVFFEVDMGGGIYLYNQDALRIEAEIDCVPPKAMYIKPTGCLALYTSPIPGEGVHMANLVTADHRVNVPTLTQWGLIILLVVLAGIATWVVLKRRRVVTA